MFCGNCKQEVDERVAYYKDPVPLCYCPSCDKYLGEGAWDDGDEGADDDYEAAYQGKPQGTP